MRSLYHARPERMHGETLVPLNRLRDVDLELYEAERAKYAGREELLELRIPVLDVRWNDALHLAPIHPRLVAAAWREAGLEPPARAAAFFEIPVERIDAARTVWFGRGALPLDDVVPFDPAAYRELEQAPAAYVEYLRECRERGRHARRFAYLPHVLTASTVDVSGLAVVSV